MVKFFSFLVIFITLVFTNEKQNIIDALEEYNKAFGEANYSKIIECFDLPSSFNLKDKTIMASHKFKLKLIYRKIIGDLPNYYSYSKWDEINIQLIDSSIAIVNADFSRYKDDNSIFYSGSAQYHLRLKNDKWKIFSLTPYETIEPINWKYCFDP